MMAPIRNQKSDATALLKRPVPSQQVRSKETETNDRTGLIGDRSTADRWDFEQAEFQHSSTGDLPSDFPETPGTESSRPKANTNLSESTFSQSIRVLYSYSVRVEKIVDSTAYVHLSEDDGEAIYAQRKVDDFGGLSVQERDLLTLRVYIEDNELKHVFERRSNSLDHEAYAAFCRDIADIYPE